MNKILLVKPPYMHVPIGFAYVLATLEKHGMPFDFIDAHLTKRDLARQLDEGGYMAVATGGLVGDYPFIHAFAHAVKELRPETPLILGGNITSCLDHELLFDRMPLDFAVAGEAETALPGLIYRIRDGGGFGGLPGVSFRDTQSGRIERTKPDVLDLDRHDPRPAWSHIDQDYYLANFMHQAFAQGRPCFPILTGRGCSGRCAFCSPTLGRFRPRRMEAIFDEMDLEAGRRRFDVFSFVTEVFFATEDEIAQFCAQYAKARFRKQWFCSLRLDVSPSVLRDMKEAGCIGVSIGFESASDDILKKMRKGIDSARGRAFVRAAKTLGLPVECNIMVGSEDETAQHVRESFSMLREEHLDSNVNLTIAYPGTLIFRHAVEKGLVGDIHTQALAETYVGLYNADIASHRYLNVSGFDSLETLHDTTMAEYRAWTGELLERYQSPPFSRLNDGRPELCFTCRSCGAANVHAPTLRQFDGLVRRKFCRECGAFSYILLLPSAVRRKAASLLGRAKRPLLMGTGMNARGLFAYPLEGIDHDKLVGVADKTIGSGAGRKFYFKPRLSLDEAANRQPDLILSLDRDLDYDRGPLDSLYGGRVPPVVPLTPNLFPVELVAGKRVLLLGGHPSLSWLAAFLEDIPGTTVAGAVVAKGDDCGDFPVHKRFPLKALFSDAWDVALLGPGAYGPSAVRKRLRMAAFLLVLTGKRPVLRRDFSVEECISWIAWRRKEVLNRIVDDLAARAKGLIAWR